MPQKIKLLRPALLSISLLTILTGAAIAPGLGYIARAFPESSPTTIKLVLTLPSIFIMVSSLLTGRLTMIMSKRVLLAIGLLLYLVGGVSGGFSLGIPFLLVSRAVLGIGVGILTPLSTSLITDFFHDEERAKMLGYATATRNFSGILATPLVGMLAASNWRMVFGVYSLSILVLALTMMVIPEPEMEAEHSSRAVKHAAQKTLPWQVFMMAGFMFLQRISFYLIPTSMAIFLEQQELGGSETAGLMISALTLSSFFFGLNYARLRHLEGRWMMAISLGAMCAGYVVLSQAQSVAMVVLAMALVGVGQGQINPMIMFKTSQYVGPLLSALAISIVGSMQFAGQFASPFVFNLLGRVLGDDSIRASFWVNGAVLGAAVAISAVSILWGQRAKTAPSPAVE